MSIARTDNSTLGRWWWTVDHWTLLALISLAVIGVMLAMAASPAVAERIGLDPLHFVRRQVAYLPLALIVIVGVSLLSPVGARRFASVVFLAALVLLIATLFVGTEIKGAKRWISVSGFSLQPSEFVKPAVAVVCAWMFAARRLGEEIPGNLIAFLLFASVAILLLLQPDVGQTLVVSAVWFSQWFLAGLPMIWVAVAFGMSIATLAIAYLVFPHVASRIDRFVDPTSGDSYQVDRAMEAFINGGLWGRGPGEGTVKSFLPDAHADFILAVAGEEFGLLLCLIIVGLFGFVVLRGIVNLMRSTDLFVVIAGTGLLVQFALQALINMGSTTSLMPTKGMTLPFISYGGSSMLALAFGMGILLALTRRRAGEVR
ncbi:MAG: putative lipid II flippase FtsW [Alphaproteobacteria bacterium MarineAlpha4_Bin2]|nr:MAG: putative lipid II flippase FtsW [Alphaproteobacteria bacterium MarineAlpha4_Bin2]